MKKLILRKQIDEVERYQKHVVDQAVEIIKHRNIQCMFTTPKILESIGERISIPGNGIKGIFCGGTTMTPQSVKFWCEEVLEGKTRLVPTYGNTLMGLACSIPLDDTYSVTYHAPQPRAVMRVVDPDEPQRTVDYDAWGRVELTTLTQEFFMPRFLERDEAIRRRPCDPYPWDGVGEVRPFRAMQETIVEGVY